MVAGIEVLNDTGNIQVTSDYSNLVLKSKVRKLGMNLFSIDGLFYAVRPDVGSRCTPYGTKGISIGNLTAYSFDLPPASPALNNTGLEIYKPNGEVAFNSNFKYMKVLATRLNNNGASVPIIEQSSEYKYTGLKTTMNFGHSNVAVIFNMGYRAFQVDDDGMFTMTLCSACELTANNDLIVYDFIDIGYESGANEDDSRPYSTESNWIVIDTTNL